MKISIAMGVMVTLVAVSALVANLSMISLQADLRDAVIKTSPLIMATQAMIAKKTQASFELHNYLNEDDPGKLVDIEKRYTDLIAEHDHFEQKIFEAIKEMPTGSDSLMTVWDDGMKTFMPQFNENSRAAIQVHNDLLGVCKERIKTMEVHEQCGLKLLELLDDLQGKYAQVESVDETLEGLKTTHTKLILASEEYISHAKILSPEQRLRIRNDYARQSGTFFELFRELKEALRQYNSPQKIEAVFLTHNEFVNSAVGPKQLFDLYEKEYELMEKQKQFIAKVDELDVADFAIASKLLELAGVNLSVNGSNAYNKAARISTFLLVFCVASLIISVVVMMSLSKRITKPIHALVGATGRIAAGDLNQKIDVVDGDEIGQLCSSFNEMSENLHGEVLVRRKAEKQREKLLEILEEKNRELQNVVYVASHDLRSPLVTINGFSEELGVLCGEVEKILESEKINEETKKKIIPLVKESIPQDLHFITAGAEKMQMLVGGLLQISRAGTAEIEMDILDMNEMLENICQAMQYELATKDISITVGDLPGCFGDAGMINQVFSNLLDNAVKYRKGNGNDSVTVSGWVEGGNSVFCVEDNGIGISSRSQSKIFEIFHRLDPHGSVSGEGLGLTIISRILDRHHGKIWVESEPDQGSKFFVLIPSNA